MLFPLLLSLVLIAFAVYAWRSLDRALILLCALTPTYLVRFSVGPIPTTLLEWFVLITIAVFVLKNHRVILNAVKDLRRSFASLKMTHVFVALIGIAAVIGTIIAPDKMSALGILKAFYLEPIILAAIMVHRFDRKHFELAFLAFCASGVVASLFAIIQILFHVGIPEAWTVEGRATSFYPYPNAVGLFLAPLVSAIVMWFVGRWSLVVGSKQSIDARRIAHDALMVVLFLLAILFAKTEAALVAIPVAVIVVLMLAPIKTQTKAIVAATSIVFGLLVFAFVPSVANKLTLNDTSGLVRRSQWSETLLMLADHPYLGVGLNAYPSALAPYHDATLYEIFQYPHNMLLNAWSELGLIGLIGLIGLMFSVARFAWENKKDPWVLACFAALLTMCIHGLVDVPFFKNDLAILAVFFFVAMMTPVHRLES